MTPYTVYALIDTRDNDIFYVGMSVDVSRRVKTHIGTRNTVLYRNAGLTPTQVRLCEIYDSGHTVEFGIVDKAVSFREARQLEHSSITLFRQNGYQLTNLVAPIGKIEPHTTPSVKLGLSGYMTTFQAAEYLQVTPARIRTLVSKGVLPKFKLGNSNMIPVEAVKSYEGSVNSGTP